MDIISSQLGVVRQIATAMGEELEKQNGMLEEVEKKVDRAGEKLENINVSMKKAVDGVRGLFTMSATLLINSLGDERR